MQTHIYSVWDFMNLLKYLQNKLTCTSIPWKPYQSAKLSRLINEIVLEEESDVIGGIPTSHFMYYYHALKKVSKNTEPISNFINDLNSGLVHEKLINQDYIPKAAQTFMNTTYEVIQQPLICVAATFAFGRESLVPSLFDPIVSQLKKQANNQFNDFINYLERHINLTANNIHN